MCETFSMVIEQRQERFLTEWKASEVRTLNLLPRVHPRVRPVLSVRRVWSIDRSRLTIANHANYPHDQQSVSPVKAFGMHSWPRS